MFNDKSNNLFYTNKTVYDNLILNNFTTKYKSSENTINWINDKVQVIINDMGIYQIKQKKNKEPRYFIFNFDGRQLRLIEQMTCILINPLK